MSLRQLSRTGSTPPARADTIRVASVPASHVYVRHLDPPHPGDGLPRVERLADPDPDSPGRSTVSRWWPPAMLEPEWVRAHRDFDVFHLQFGFDAQTPAQLGGLVAALRETGRPLVQTVHDLRNPHHATRAEHDAQLDVLIPAADALVTLTPGAAAEIRRRWGRDARVLPHPHVVEADRIRLARIRRPRARREGFRVGVHVKSLRASMNPLPILRVLAAAIGEIPGGVLQVNGHRDVLRPGGAGYEPELGAYLAEAEAAGLLELHVHDFLPDAALWDYLESLDASVLPYRFGTHSGWLEACRDLGTAVIAPTCGYYREQGPVFAYGNDEDGLDEESLLAALHDAAVAGAPEPLPVEHRLGERQAIADAHARLYRDLLR
ncbi:glycosyltransferase [Microbacterium sp. 18062]|uniref:glycosyltransferase n=1 Tax=Microbacterium sp. 18062 TaxID=2681410 RepID=UPI001F16EBFA|nr:glycosyltransferase [Microbacterium sp. 18062]